MATLRHCELEQRLAGFGGFGEAVGELLQGGGGFGVAAQLGEGLPFMEQCGGHEGGAWVLFEQSVELIHLA